ncbi:hypothetical protein [Nocardia sp. CA-135398]|uniref:hypothetical protein n=1 Tax=Nocardia sp. CA-135398 TaxID=3239977 RepID=UPI003D981DD4
MMRRTIVATGSISEAQQNPRSRGQRLVISAATLLAAAGIAGTALAAAPAAHADVPSLYPLYTWWNPERGDNFTTGNLNDENSATAADYLPIRKEAFVYETQQPGTVPLHLFWSNSRQDNFSTATQVGIDSAYSAGYTHIGIQGYINTSQEPGTRPLYQFWSEARQDNVVAVDQTTIDSAYSAGYVLVRVEGYAPYY